MDKGIPESGLILSAVAACHPTVAQRTFCKLPIITFINMPSVHLLQLGAMPWVRVGE